MRSRGVLVKYIVMRNRYFDGIRNSRAVRWDVPDGERDKGVVATFENVKVLLTDRVEEVLKDGVLLVPDEETGKLAERERMVARFDPVPGPADLQFSAYCEVGHAVRRRSNLVLLTDVEVGGANLGADANPA